MKIPSYKLLVALSIVGFSLLPSFVSASTAVAEVYVSPDAFKPDQPNFVISYEIKNNTGKTINQIQIKKPLAGFPMTFVSIDQPNFFLSGGTVVFGDTDHKLDFKNGTRFTAKVTYNIGSFDITNNPLQNNVYGNDFTGAGVVPPAVQNGHAVLLITLPSVGSPQFFTALGNDTFTLSNNPQPLGHPLDWNADNAYSNGLNGSGLTDASRIRGLFPAGPVDSLLILPLTLGNIILQSTNPSTVQIPTMPLFGKTISYPQGQLIYQNLGTSVTVLISTSLSFFILLVWSKSLYARLQRATELNSHPNDTWGLL